jgi:hypothetical protein
MEIHKENRHNNDCITNFLMFMDDSGLKTHQSSCDWASDSLNTVNSVLNCCFQRRNDKKKRENGKLQTRSDENKKKKIQLII